MARRVGAERNGNRDGAWTHGERQCERVERTAQDVRGIHVFLDLAAFVGIFLLEKGPAIGDDDEAAPDLDDRDRDAKEGENVRADKVRRNDQNKTIERNAAGEKAAGGFGIVRRKSEKNRCSANGIHDGEEGADNKKDTFSDFEQRNSPRESIAEVAKMTLLARFSAERVQEFRSGNDLAGVALGVVGDVDEQTADSGREMLAAVGARSFYVNRS